MASNSDQIHQEALAAVERMSQVTPDLAAQLRQLRGLAGPARSGPYISDPELQMLIKTLGPRR